MLEQQNLVNKTKDFSTWGPWKTLPLLLAFCSLLLCISLNLSLIKPPVQSLADEHLQQQQEAMAALQAMTLSLRPSQVIDESLVQNLRSQGALLKRYRSTLGSGAGLDQARDPGTFMGRLNLIADELQNLDHAAELPAQFQSLQKEMKAARSPLAAKRYPDGSSARGFQWVALSWLKTPVSGQDLGPWTWQTFDEGKAIWQSMIGQMSAFSLDLASSDEGARKIAAKDLRDFLQDRGFLDRLRQTDVLYTQVIGAKERLLNWLNDMPPPPPIPLSSTPAWQAWVLPGTLDQGLMGLLVVNAAMVLLCMAQLWAHKAGMRRLADEWLTWVVRQEVKIRKTSPRLQTLKDSIAKMSDELDQMADRFLTDAQSIAIQTGDNQSGPQGMGLKPLQAGLQQDLRNIREKLLNVQVQFCNGDNHEHLIHDMNDMAQMFESVEHGVITLTQQLDLIGHLQADPDVIALPVLTQQWRTEVLEFKRQLKTVRKELENLEGLIDRAADKVPQSLRFEDMAVQDTSGGRIEAAR